MNYKKITIWKRIKTALGYNYKNDKSYIIQKMADGKRWQIFNELKNRVDAERFSTLKEAKEYFAYFHGYLR